jgi:hypothetical protein
MWFIAVIASAHHFVSAEYSYQEITKTRLKTSI